MIICTRNLALSSLAVLLLLQACLALPLSHHKSQQTARVNLLKRELNSTNATNVAISTDSPLRDAKDVIDSLDSSATYNGTEVKSLLSKIVEFIKFDVFTEQSRVISDYIAKLNGSFTGGDAGAMVNNKKSNKGATALVVEKPAKTTNSNASTVQAQSLKASTSGDSPKLSAKDAKSLEASKNADSTSQSQQSLTSDQQGCVDVHNAARKEVGVSNIAWDSSLLPGAKQWSERLATQGCMLQHSTNFGSQGAVGESLYMASYKSGKSLTDAANAFYREKTGFGQKGHYQAMIKSSNTRVACYAAYGSSGCAVVTCRYGSSGSSSGSSGNSIGSGNFDFGSLSSLFSQKSSGGDYSGLQSLLGSSGYGGSDESWSSLASKFGSGGGNWGSYLNKLNFLNY